MDRRRQAASGTKPSSAKCGSHARNWMMPSRRMSSKLMQSTRRLDHGVVAGRHMEAGSTGQVYNEAQRRGATRRVER
jgi:hypothetical protein